MRDFQDSMGVTLAKISNSGEREQPLVDRQSPKWRDGVTNPQSKTFDPELFQNYRDKNGEEMEGKAVQ
jgi:hypothetical protein